MDMERGTSLPADPESEQVVNRISLRKEGQWWVVRQRDSGWDYLRFRFYENAIEHVRMRLSL